MDSTCANESDIMSVHANPIPGAKANPGIAQRTSALTSDSRGTYQDTFGRTASLPITRQASSVAPEVLRSNSFPDGGTVIDRKLLEAGLALSGWGTILFVVFALVNLVDIFKESAAGPVFFATFKTVTGAVGAVAIFTNKRNLLTAFTVQFVWAYVLEMMIPVIYSLVYVDLPPTANWPYSPPYAAYQWCRLTGLDQDDGRVPGCKDYSADISSVCFFQSIWTLYYVLVGFSFAHTYRRLIEIYQELTQQEVQEDNDFDEESPRVSGYTNNAVDTFAYATNTMFSGARRRTGATNKETIQL